MFTVFLCSILLSFFYVRPLDSPWQRFIAGDGLGYYAYLPAKFIYHDQLYEYKWFNSVYEKEYLNFGNASADENFLVVYKGKKVNKYYPGLSFLWLPFFGLAHICALVFQFPANGFSLPYQWSIGLASLFYLFLGLFYLRKLLFLFSGKAWIAFLVPVVFFYGSYLFEYAIHSNSLSHVYSFSLLVVFSYYAFRFLNEEENRWYHLLFCVFLFFLLVSIRPLNGIVLVLLPALAIRKFNFTVTSKAQPVIPQVTLILLILWVLVRQLYLLKLSTGEFFPNTYEGESFRFLQARFWDSGFGFQNGMFLYAPLLLFSFAGVCYYPGSWKRWVLPLFYFFVFYLYASWWFWPITSRALVDYTVIPALLLSAFLNRIQNKKLIVIFVALLGVLCAYHQFKQMQFRRGILDKNYTHSQLFFKNFFKIQHSHQFAVPPYSILHQTSLIEDFEENPRQEARSERFSFKGKYSTFLDEKNEYTPEFASEVPEFLFGNGIAKVRYSLQVRAEEEMKEFQVYMNFYDANKNQTLSFPFYVKEEVLSKTGWKELEFGHEFSAEELSKIRKNRMAVFIWNSSKKNRLYVDHAKLEFFLCNRSAEIVP